MNAIGPDQDFIEFQEALAGRYSLETELGRGGMGIVYLARDVRLDRQVAIKVLPRRLAANAILRDRFTLEARTAAKLSHPNIVQIFTVDQIDGFAFFVMAHISGETLGERVRRRGPLTPSDGSRILMEVAWALAYAHAQGVVHRDIKPDNILLEELTGRALVADFGIAGWIENQGSAAVGEISGTAEFMSPEQATGQGVDPRSDIYSLGVVGYFIFSGQLPSSGDTPVRTVEQVWQPSTPRLAAVAGAIPARLVKIVERCLVKDPSLRYQTGEAFAEALEMTSSQSRQIPMLVRTFLHDPVDLAGDAPLYYGLGVFMVAPFVVSSLVAGLPDPGAVAIATAIWLGAPFASTLGPIRRLLATGHTRDDVLLAARKDLNDRIEERAYLHGFGRSRLEQVTTLVARTGLAATAAVGLVAVVGQGTIAGATFQTMGTIFATIAAVTVAAAFVARHQTTKRIDVKAERRLVLWRSVVGKWLFKLAGLGLRRKASVIGATHRPTELHIGLAAEALYAELPRAVRKGIGDVPGVVRQLEGDARTLRQTLDRLNDNLSVSVLPSDGAPDDLQSARHDLHRQLTDVVAALETIRLGLLRLRSGTGDVQGLTTHLSEARRLAEKVNALVDGIGDVERLLESQG